MKHDLHIATDEKNTGSDSPAKVFESEMLPELIKDIERYCRMTRQGISSFCSRVANNASLYSRLKEGGDCNVTSLEKIRLYMEENPAPDDAADQSKTAGAP